MIFFLSNFIFPKYSLNLFTNVYHPDIQRQFILNQLPYGIAVVLFCNRNGNAVKNNLVIGINARGTINPCRVNGIIFQKSNNFVFNNSLCYTVCIIFCLNIYIIKIKIKFFVAYLSKRKEKRNKNKKRDNRFIKSAAAALWRKERKYYRNDNG